MIKKILAAIVLIIGFSTVPLFAFAQTSSASCPSITRNLYLGTRGNDVVQLQQFLRTQNYFTYPTDTGYFGVATENAVKAFQAARGIVSSGTARTTGFGAVGLRTRAEISTVCNTSQTSTPPPTTATTISESSETVPVANPLANCVSSSDPAQELPVDFRIREGFPPTATNEHSQTYNWPFANGKTIFAEGLYSDGVWKPLSSGVAMIFYSVQNPSVIQVYGFKMNGSSITIDPYAGALSGQFVGVNLSSDKAHFSGPAMVTSPGRTEADSLLWATANLNAYHSGDPRRLPCNIQKTYTIHVSSSTTPTPTPPTLTIVQPNTNAALTAGADSTVGWDIRNVTVGDTVTVRVTNGQQTYSTTRTVRSGEENSNMSVALPIPSTATPGSYTLSVTLSGGVSAQIPVQVRAPIAPITVESPNGGEVWQAGSTRTIRWSGGLTDSRVALYVGSGAGDDYTEITPSTPNTGSYAWTIPADKASGSYKIRVNCVSSCGDASSEARMDTSNSTFSITGAIIPPPPPPPALQPTLTIVQPAAGAIFTAGIDNSVGWEQRNATIGDTVTIRVFNAQQNYSTTYRVRDISARVFTSISIPSTATPGSYTLSVTLSGGVSAQTPIQVQEAAAAVTVISPNGGESWQAGSTQTIRWSGGLPTGRIALYVTKDGGVDWTEVTSSTPNTGSYSWTIPANKAPGQYKIVVIALDTATTKSMLDTSDRTFTIVAPTQPPAVQPTLTIVQIYPDAPFTAGIDNSVGWEQRNATIGDTVTIRVFNAQQNYSTTYRVRDSNSRIFTSIPIPSSATPGSYTLSVSLSGGVSAQIPIQVQAAGSLLTVISPNGGESWQAGSTQTIRWSGGLPTGRIALYVSKVAGDDYRSIAPNIQNTGSYAWTIPADKAPGQYKIWVISLDSTNGSSGAGFDTSNLAFSVVAPVSLGGSSTQTASALNAFTNPSQNDSVPATTPRFSYEWTNDLQIGSTNLTDVVALQIALRNEGVYGGDITGGFYDQTFAAVKAFQQKYGIEATGYVGSITRAKLNNLY